ncbi:MAG: ATP-binding protein [Acidobacteriota bacterium]
MNNRLFWKLGLIYLLMLLLVIVALSIYVVEALKGEYLESAYTQLKSVSRVGSTILPLYSKDENYQVWADMLAQSGVRVTLISVEGFVLADTDEDPAAMENHAARPEIRDAFRNGTGRSVRHSRTLGRDLVYYAMRYEREDTEPFVMRFSIPVHRLDDTLYAFRYRLFLVALVVMAMGGGASLLYFRTISERIKRLQEFSHRVADGDFQPMPRDRKGDELSDLSDSLNRTARELDDSIRTLTEERNQSAAILSSMEEGVVVVGCDQLVIYCNRNFCRSMEVSESGWYGRPILELIRHSDLISYIQKVMAVEQVIRGEVVVGTVRTHSFAVTAAPIRSEGSTTGAVMVLHDISEIKRLERARRDFIANISHEFKTPLTAIQGFSETLLDGAVEDTKNRDRFLKIIRDHAQRLSRLTEDLLKLAQIEAGQLPYDARFVSLAEIINHCMDTARVKAKRKDLVLESEYANDLPKLYGDLQAFHEILENLLDNAVRYSPTGGTIQVKAAVEESEMVISVSDNGIGIPKVEQERIFERFYRADAARSRESGGTGLGLSIVKHLVEAQGGRILVDSEVGVGSTFYVYIPLQEEPEIRE